MAHVVTCFLRHDGRVLLTRRSDAVGTYAGRWAGVSGYVEGSSESVLADARREIREETRLTASLVRGGDPIAVRDGDREWTVHPFLFAAESRDVTPNEEIAAWEWVHPTAMRRRETVPRLWDAYERVAPTVETVRTDREHGSTYLSCRALEVLRDRAATAAAWSDAADVARALRDARPTMAAVANRVNRVLSEADRDPDAVAERAAAALDDAVVADREAAAAAADLLDDAAATLSRSETVLAALGSAGVSAVVGESRVGREGVDTAERLARGGVEVTLVPDAVLPGTLADLAGRPSAASALVGADAVLPDGAAVNRTGSYPLALAAADAGRPFRVVAARDKVRPDDAVPDEREHASVYDGDASVDAAQPLFERVPSELVDAVVTEDGVLDADGVAAAAATHREHAAWDE